MINIQLKHAPFSNDLVNDECGRWLNYVSEDTNPDRPDRYWIMAHADEPLYTYGTKAIHNSADMPNTINGIPVQPQIRNGGITYHGPGQISWVAVLNYRRLLRHGDILNMQDFMVKFCNSVNAEFNETLVSDPADPGLYRTSGEKILSFGIDAPGVSWVAIKLSLNVCVDLSAYNNTATCGVNDRSMGNLMSNLPDLGTQARMGENIIRRLCAEIYESHQIVDWA